MIAQRQFNLAINQRTVLVTVDTVRACLGVDAETINAKVDAGEYRFAFDVSAVRPRRLLSAKHVRELRLWTKEVIMPETTSGLTLLEAVQQILGTRERFGGTEVAQLLLVSRPQIFRLHEGKELPGDIVGGKLWITRRTVQDFLLRRSAAEN
jgi:hypothetical protein